MLGILLVCNTVFAQSSFKPGSEPNGFRGNRWGVEINTFTSMKEVDIGDDYKGIPQPPIDPYMLQHAKHYIKTDDSLQIEGVKVEKIIYGFWKGRLMSVSAKIEDKENFQKLKNALFQKYGEVQPTAAGFAVAYSWQGNVTVVVLSDYSESLGHAVLEFTSVNEQNAYSEDLRQNMKND